jgi:hypothetical protein
MTREVTFEGTMQATLVGARSSATQNHRQICLSLLRRYPQHRNTYRPLQLRLAARSFSSNAETARNPRGISI